MAREEGKPLNEGIGGQLDGPSSYLMKSPHNQRPDEEARVATQKFIAKNRRKALTQPKGRKGTKPVAAADKA